MCEVICFAWSYDINHLPIYDDTDVEFNPLPKTFVKDSLGAVDRVLEQYCDLKDIYQTRNESKLGRKIPTHRKPGISEEDKLKLQVQLYNY